MATGLARRNHLYDGETTCIDGTIRWEVGWSITIPLPSCTTLFAVVVIPVPLFQAFVVASLMLRWAAGYTNLTADYIFSAIFVMQPPGCASALSALLLPSSSPSRWFTYRWHSCEPVGTTDTATTCLRCTAIFLARTFLMLNCILVPETPVDAQVPVQHARRCTEAVPPHACTARRQDRKPRRHIPSEEPPRNGLFSTIILGIIFDRLN